MKARLKRGKATLLGGLAVAALLVGCAVEVQNTKPAQDLARRALPPGDVATGWRVFQQKCAGCHGVSATGTAQGPDLLPRVHEMGSRRFVGLVLKRYDWMRTAAESEAQGVGRDELIDKIVQGREGALLMPAWDGNPTVTAHIIDLYAYLSARADGRQGAGRPSP